MSNGSCTPCSTNDNVPLSLTSNIIAILTFAYALAASAYVYWISLDKYRDEVAPLISTFKAADLEYVELGEFYDER